MAARYGTEVSTPRKGATFGGWTFLKQIRGNRAWLCRCVCGVEKPVQSYGVRLGIYKTCGCKRSGPVTHGKSKSRAYACWASMIQRCTNPRSSSYPAYGGAGITVCERWRDFGLFYADMGDPPTNTHSLDRRDGSKGYSPENVAWATRQQQNTNRRNTVLIASGGEVLSIAAWARRIGVPDQTLRSRLFILMWEPSRALGLPDAEFLRVQT